MASRYPRGDAFTVALTERDFYFRVFTLMIIQLSDFAPIIRF